MRYAWPLTCLASSVVFAVASCGGSGATTTDGGGGFTSASGSEGSANGGSGSGTKSNSASSFVGTGTGTGGSGSGVGGGATCPTATTCAAQHANCGEIADGCGGLLTCGMGSTCPNPGDSCGGGNVPNTCGHATCTPGGQELCTTPGFNCGDVSDGCGGSVHCGDCTGNQVCGANNMPDVCGSGTCTPLTDCTSLGFDCGMQSDGCGGQIDCGTCSAPNICGAVTPSVCGLPPCTPQSCSDQGIGCGPASDQCNNVIDCGGCSLPNTCSGNPSTCNIPSTCTNLCLDQVSCPANNMPATTQLSGTVYAPNGVDPLPNVLVYIPNGAVTPFTPGVTCDNCSASVTGNPLVSTSTDTHGNFTLTNIPVPDSMNTPSVNTIPVVIQTGRWRRQITISNVQSCIDNQIPTTACTGTGTNCPTRLPRNKGEGDIPHIAFSTGSVDALECVFRKIGVDDAEFTAPSGNGRIHLYSASLDGGAHVGQAPTLQTTLFATQAAIDAYDMVLFPCVGAEHDQAAADQAKLIAYANAGGRVFATHYSYVWLFNDAPFSGTAQWQVVQADPAPDPGTGFIDQTFPKGQELAQWLQFIQLPTMTTLGQIPIAVLRKDFNAVIAPAQPWMYAESPTGSVMHYTFNTPTTATPDNQCGRVLFDDFHVEDAVTDGVCGAVHCFNPATGVQIAGGCGADGAACGTGGTCHRSCSVNGYCPTGSPNGATCGKSFPTECTTGAMTPQEKLLEFMIFDLGSCVTPDQPSCTPSSCMDLGIGCGPAGDGCGNLQQCGTCPTGQTCGGGGMAGQCGTPSCTPLTCLDIGVGCGPAGDGCGGQLDCGTCTPPATCGGGGNPGHCGTGSCTPETCTQLNIHCGPAGDGCGNTIQCGTCPTGQTCGGGGMPGVCGSSCTKLTCAGLGYNCGPAGDGCGGQLDCGVCSPPQTCGGGGMPNVCGGAGPH